MNPAESANYENMLSAMGSGGRAAARGNEILSEIKQLILLKLDGSRAAALSEWTDRDMTVGNRLYLAGSVTVADILDHAAREAKADLHEGTSHG